MQSSIYLFLLSRFATKKKKQRCNRNSLVSVIERERNFYKKNIHNNNNKARKRKNFSNSFYFCILILNQPLN